MFAYIEKLQAARSIDQLAFLCELRYIKHFLQNNMVILQSLPPLQLSHP